MAKAMPTWMKAYWIALSETDPAKLPQLINVAKKLVCDELETKVNTTQDSERLLAALNGLQVLRRECEVWEGKPRV
jgi:hypothetical protein